MNKPRAENIIGALVLTLSDSILNATQTQAPPNISAAGLALIGHVPGLSIYELSAGLGLSHPGAVRLVDRMVADGLVVRQQSKTDGRVVALFLTANGEEREKVILSSRHQVLNSALSTLSAEEYAAFAQISEKLIRALLQDETHALKMCRLCNSKACTGCPVDAELLSKSEA
jgi:DNA-binding MarR family transcriptional regulator